MIAAAILWLAALAEDLSGAPGEAQAVLGALAVGVLLIILWGGAAELRVRAFQKQTKAAARLSRCLFAAAGLRRKRWLP